jgi:hypothetical protein
MSENEALEELKTFPINCLDFKENQALQVAINALEEIQEYREIGTVEELKAIKNDGGFTDDLLNMGYTKGIKDGYAKAIDEVMEVVKRTYHNFSGYDLEFMTKYGNKNASQQAESYSTLMMYEIAGEFDDLLDSLEQLKGGAE